MNESNVKDLATFYQRMLLDDCLPFWFPRSIDTEHGGYLHCVDRDGTVVDTDKSVWAQGRMSWMLASLADDPVLADHPQRCQWIRWSASGVKFLQEHCFDRGQPSSDGRMYFHVTRDGRPIRKRRYAYSESFAAIAFGAQAKLTGSQVLADQAMELFRFFVRWNFTPGLMPAKATDVRPGIGLAPRMITIVTAQELRHSLGDHPELNLWIDRCIQEIEHFFVKPDLKCVMECVSPDGSVMDHFDGRTLNPGHAIEGAWFILREGEHRADSQLIQLGCRMLDWKWERGWDQEHGGLLYFCDVYGRPVQEYWHDMKFWWPHDEALIATLFAWKLSGERRYLDWHIQLQDWAFRHFADPEFGEWYGYLHRDGSRSSTLKGNLWKSAFHHPRAMHWCWKLTRD